MSATQRKPRLRRVSFWLLIIVGVPIGFLILLALAGVRVDLTEYKGTVESGASSALGRPVLVDGDIDVTVSLWPSLEIKGIRIPNPEGFEDGDLARMERAYVKVSVLPLLAGKLHVKETHVVGMDLNLRRTTAGANNWASQRTDIPSAPDSPKDEPPGERPPLTSDSLVVGDLSLDDISVSYSRGEGSEPVIFRIDESDGSARAGEPFELSLRGVLGRQAFDAQLSATSLQELLELNRSRMDIEVSIADTTLQLAGIVDLSQRARSLQFEVGVAGDRLDSLNHLLELDLPPLRDYRASAVMTLEPESAELSSFEIAVRNSALTGEMSIDRSSDRPAARASFVAKTIQLDDFNVEGWSPDGGASESGGAADEDADADTGKSEGAEKTSTGSATQATELFDPEILARYDAALSIEVDEVRSGDDVLGRGRLEAGLDGGRLSLGPVQLDVPGGSVMLSTSLKPGAAQSEATLRVLIDRFDFGIFTRRKNPDAKLGGTLSVDLDLRATASRIEDILAGGNGYIHISGNPENLEAGIIDLWAVNLVASIVSESEKDEDGVEPSTINCLVSHWSMKDGVLSADRMVIDTSRIRICGTGDIDFGSEAIDLTIAPTAKRPEFFSLATPLVARGGFDDFRMGIKRGSLGTTAVKFITSPVHTPLRRVFGRELPEDGSDVCALPLGPEADTQEDVAGC